MSDDKNAEAGAQTAGCSDCSRRNLIAATAVVGGAAGLGAAVPFALSFTPSERAKAAGAPVEADISALKPGEKMVVEWRGKPVWIIRRTPEMLASLKATDPLLADPESKRSEQPEYVKGDARSIKPEYLVCIGICTHLGCSPSDKLAPGAEGGMGADWHGGFLCPCHGSQFDLAGRVLKSMPAPDNLPIPPHKYLSDSKILIGEDSKGA
ncbi:ubiquinol-cytochrome c reductase iron-sulfur subunit [Uliginosibacterium sp. H3]|uniref:Ubiquinol-cytochrome c reductase iron-sulfur subunit n=1 Tax=Uliginosibacterium silvisoli TaxID=3114758 RepID=A0ABU6K4D6_9RHOO|nr:ubiquinol-cytochrome c reductase iron-sulfur subunit [Uliginosibacterium sp. H3]